jgi:5-methylcytosine-specific restriction endonuclease McrA
MSFNIRKYYCCEVNTLMEYFMSKQYTQEQLILIQDTTLNAKEVGEQLSLPTYTIQHIRNKLGIKGTAGRKKGCQSSIKGTTRSSEIGKKISEAKRGKPNPKKERKEVRTCIGKDCSNTFIVVPSRTKKYCSHSCQQKTANVAAKGIGSRKIRNPATPEYKKYARQVHGLSQKIYEKNIDIINPNRHPRTVCGVEGGWQLDHVIPIKECFEKGITIEEASAITNLRMLPWKTNLMRQYVVQN